MTRLKQIARLLTMPCEGFARLASESLDRDLPRPERWALAVHLAYCVACRRYRRQLALIRAAAERLRARDEADTPALSPEARDRLRRALGGE
ncbi:MAG TPA: zf-HC2 domain-containing protein [Isosphaeraceae bacterium]|jgi:hypothetical protein|nr:zf-HC2 domain-containing protein [Isosphaeraceae bacterium]